MTKFERRRPEAYRLRVYIDAIKDAEGMTHDAWVNAYIEAAKLDSNAVYVPLPVWLDYLKTCALRESEKLLNAVDKAA